MSIKKSKTRGFSLIELLVALGLFSFVITITTTGLLSLLDANAKSQTLRLAMDNLSFVLDNLSRNVRTGYNYLCYTSAPSGPDIGSDTDDCTDGEALAFTDGETGNRVTYRLYNDSIERGVYDSDNGIVNPSSPWRLVTASNVKITDLEFLVSGTDYNTSTGAGKDEQPTVTIWLTGKVGSFKKTASEFEIQTTVTQRILDL